MHQELQLRLCTQHFQCWKHSREIHLCGVPQLRHRFEFSFLNPPRPSNYPCHNLMVFKSWYLTLVKGSWRVLDSSPGLLGMHQSCPLARTLTASWSAVLPCIPARLKSTCLENKCGHVGVILSVSYLLQGTATQFVLGHWEFFLGCRDVVLRLRL